MFWGNFFQGGHSTHLIKGKKKHLGGGKIESGKVPQVVKKGGRNTWHKGKKKDLGNKKLWRSGSKCTLSSWGKGN